MEEMKFRILKEKVSRNTLESIKKMGFKHMTEIQKEVLPVALDGADIVASAKTGSGKTLAFLVPIVEVVLKKLAKETQGKCPILNKPIHTKLCTYVLSFHL